MEKNKWWGYIHNSGSVHLKRYFSGFDLQEARESPFVKSVHGPWLCQTREEAEQKLKSERTCHHADGFPRS